MTPENSKRITEHYDALDEDLKNIVTKTPTHLTGKDLEGYLHYTLSPHAKNLQIRLENAVQNEDYELAVAIQRFLKTRLRGYA